MTNFNWYFTRDEIDNKTPSRDDGIPLATEIRYRRDGARFIINASNTLGLRYETTATGVVFFHRFYMIQSFRQFNRWVVAAACLLLAGKVEETPKKCRDIIKVSQSLLTEQQMTHFGSSPKDELMTLERILLQTIKFDLQVQHPYSYLLKFAKQLKGEKAKIEKLVQMAWTFMNDSLCTSLCLQWEPQAIAIAFIYLAGKLSKFDLQTSTGSRSRSWWRQYLDTLDVHDLDSICHQVIDIYGEEEKSGEDTSRPAQTPQQSSPLAPQLPPAPQSQQPTPPTQHTPHPPPSLQPVAMATNHSLVPLPSSIPPSYHQYPSLYQQPLATLTNLHTHTSPHRPALFPMQPGQNTHLPPATQNTPVPSANMPIQSANTPLAFSTLNVNVSSTTPSQHPPSLPGPAVPGPPAAGGANNPYTYDPLLTHGGAQLPASAPSSLPQRSYSARGGAGLIGSYLLPGFKTMPTLLGTGGGLLVGGVAGSVGLSSAGFLGSRPGMEAAAYPPTAPGLNQTTPHISLLSSHPLPSASSHPLPRASNVLPTQQGVAGGGGTFQGTGLLATGGKQLSAQSPIPGTVHPPPPPPPDAPPPTAETPQSALGGGLYQSLGGGTGWTR